jgi:hypothetical protein
VSFFHLASVILKSIILLRTVGLRHSGECNSHGCSTESHSAACNDFEWHSN